MLSLNKIWYKYIVITTLSLASSNEKKHGPLTKNKPCNEKAAVAPKPRLKLNAIEAIRWRHPFHSMDNYHRKRYWFDIWFWMGSRTMNVAPSPTPSLSTERLPPSCICTGINPKPVTGLFGGKSALKESSPVVFCNTNPSVGNVNSDKAILKHDTYPNRFFYRIRLFGGLHCVFDQINAILHKVMSPRPNHRRIVKFADKIHRWSIPQPCLVETV